MIRVRVTSATPVVVGHRRLLPGEIHEVAGAALNEAVVLYGADAFKVLDGAPVAPSADNDEAGGDASSTDDAGDPEIEPVVDAVEEATEEPVTTRHGRRKG